MNSAIQNTSACIEELRESVIALDQERSAGKETEASVKRVRKALLKLRRAHANARESQSDQQRRMIDAVKKLRAAQTTLENSRFVESQCEFLVSKYNSAQFPEFEKVRATLPSVEEYTEKHKNEPGFVSHDADPHQFMLNMLASELEERNGMEEEIVVLQQQEAEIKREMVRKREYINSLAGKLQELSACVDGLAKLLTPE